MHFPSCWAKIHDVIHNSGVLTSHTQSNKSQSPNFLISLQSDHFHRSTPSTDLLFPATWTPGVISSYLTALLPSGGDTAATRRLFSNVSDILYLLSYILPKSSLHPQACYDLASVPRSLPPLPLLSHSAPTSLPSCHSLTLPSTVPLQTLVTAVSCPGTLLPQIWGRLSPHLFWVSPKVTPCQTTLWALVRTKSGRVASDGPLYSQVGHHLVLLIWGQRRGSAQDRAELPGFLDLC